MLRNSLAIATLPLLFLEDLGKTVFNFSEPADLMTWLQARQQ
jgi:hypothetical protein